MTVKPNCFLFEYLGHHMTGYDNQFLYLAFYITEPGNKICNQAALNRFSEEKWKSDIGVLQAMYDMNIEYRFCAVIILLAVNKGFECSRGSTAGIPPHYILY